MPVAKQGETKADAEFGRAGRVADWIGGVAADPGPAPVHLWHPDHCGAIDIRIDRAGLWHHEGRRIEREALVRLFARVLRREADGSHVLVTPAEKLTISVEDAPFLAVDIAVASGPEGPRVSFLTNLGEVVPLDSKHELRIAPGGPDEPFIPYIEVRRGLEARLTQSVAAEFAGLAEVRDGRIGVESAGQFFVIGEAGATRGERA